jgi:hypothetical protein
MATLSPYEQLRRAIRDLFILARGDLEVLWRSVGDSAEAQQALMELLPELIATYGLAAGSVAADFYDQVREEEEAPKRFRAIVPEMPEQGIGALVGWALATAAGVHSTANKGAADNVVEAVEKIGPEDLTSFRTLVEGGMQRRIANQARLVITTSSIADPSAKGWMRVGGGGCDFCALLITRGAVYTEKSVEFASHDHCNCGAAPAFNPEQIKKVKSEFVPSARNQTKELKQANRERVQQWIDANL